LVEGIGLSCPTGINDERQKSPFTKGFPEKQKKPFAAGALHAPAPPPLAREPATQASPPQFITIGNEQEQKKTPQT
jgi:hypothetical protein